MAARLTIYLAGPIRGCSPEQRSWWREEVKQELKRDFDFEDPTEWTDDFVVSRETRMLEACDILLANMWKESIGTTLGIVRARRLGKPVVLVDANRIRNAILEELVAPESPVNTLQEAYGRLRELSRQFQPFLVRKKSGADEDFDTKKLVGSVARAAAAAGVSDGALEKQISGPVIAKLRALGTRVGLVETVEIRQALFEQIEWMAADPGRPMSDRARAKLISDAWERREGLKDPEREIIEARLAIESITRECEQLQTALAEKDARIRELERHPETAPEPEPTSLVEALSRLGREHSTCVIIHDDALDSAISSPYAHLDRAWTALRLLGRCAQERQLAQITDTDFPGFRQWFSRHQEEAPWLEYAANEGQITKGKFGTERTVTHEGNKILAAQHLCLGDSSDPKYCLRIHFAPLGDKVIVAHCGRHLRTKSHN